MKEYTGIRVGLVVNWRQAVDVESDIMLLQWYRRFLGGSKVASNLGNKGRLRYRLSLIILLWRPHSGRSASTNANLFCGVLLSIVEPQTLNSITRGAYNGSPRQKPFHFCHGGLRLGNLIQEAPAIIAV